MKNIENKKDYLLIKLLLGIAIGVVIGILSNAAVINVVQSIKYVLNQVISFMVPLIVLGFIAPAITRMGNKANKMLGVMLALAYLSSVGAALFSVIAGYAIIPNLNIASNVAGGKALPEMIFKLDINPLFPVITALFLAICGGVAIVKTKSQYFENLLDELNNIILFLVNNIVVPILPFYIGSTFATLSYEGTIIKSIPIFLIIIIITIAGHFIWLTVLYTIAGIISKKNPIRVLKHYGPAYFTAVGTMSSAATLPVALKCAGKSDALDKDIVDFAIPMGATIHLCGSVLTETFFVMTISKILYGHIPPIGTMILFIILLGIFAVGAPGVPGGTVVASLGIIISVLGFNNDGTALILAIFALQDSFGTACNVTGDGALALMLQGIFKKDKTS
ncbi:dicarboxylate/amino acid:cation symporter [uncultured Brachyspira sp.]|uniref:dicarboxylate/amino acid:cation symporter n=1 Tax=uncultured Brachyspira sp. TaxID=221953 RepID=UPI0025EE803E|nr:dicarboxylate/amino acid:cation symporter [uncultured Brachyspira sp.]